MPPQTTVEPPNTGSPSPANAVPPRDGLPSMDSQLALSQANELLAQALATRDAAYAHLAENPDDVNEANVAVHAAQQTVNEIREIARGQRRGDATRVTNLLAALNNQVRAATAEVSDHDGPVAGEAQKRSAHQAEVSDQKEAAQKSSASAATLRARTRTPRRAPRTREDEEGTAEARNRNAGRNEANEGDALGQAAAAAAADRAARGARPRSRDDDDAPDAHRVRRRGESRGQAQRRTAVRRSTYDAARVVGILDDQGAQTAQRLETGVVHAQNDEERQYYERERGDAIARRLGGRTFLGQEIDNALPQLERTAVGRELINQDNTFSNSLYNSSVVDRLRANGYIVGDRSWNPFAHSTNSQWSDAAVRRIDRNGDGQLSAAELERAMTHRYQAPAPQPAGQSGGDAARDQQAARTALGRQVQGMLAGLQQHKAQLDVDRDGRVELWEACERLRARGVTQIWDANGDGRINAADVPVMWNDPSKRTPPRRNT